MSQLQRLPDFIARRQEIAQRYQEALKDLPLQLPAAQTDTQSAYHLFIVRLASAEQRLDIYQQLREKGVGTQVHYIPVYKQPYYQALGFADDYCPNAEAYYQGALSIPMYSALSDDEQSTVINALTRLLTG